MSVSISSQPQEKTLSLSRFSLEDIELLKTTICKGGSDEDLKLLLYACNRTGLDPFMRQIYSIPRKDYKANTEVRTIQTGIDGYRLIAERTGKYMPGRECSFVHNSKNELVSATAYVKKLGPDKQWHEIAHTVYWDEYAALKDGKPVALWRDKPHVMLAKCAESSCLRRAFPADLSGIYTKEEMAEVDIEDLTPIQSERPSNKEAKTIDQKPFIEEKKSEPLDTTMIASYSINRVSDRQLAEIINSIHAKIHPVDPEYKNRALAKIAAARPVGAPPLEDYGDLTESEAFIMRKNIDLTAKMIAEEELKKRPAPEPISCD